MSRECIICGKRIRTGIKYCFLHRNFRSLTSNVKKEESFSSYLAMCLMMIITILFSGLMIWLGLSLFLDTLKIFPMITIFYIICITATLLIGFREYGMNYKGAFMVSFIGLIIGEITLLILYGDMDMTFLFVGFIPLFGIMLFISLLTLYNIISSIFCKGFNKNRKDPNNKEY